MIEKASDVTRNRVKGVKTEPYFSKGYIKNEGAFFRKLRKNKDLKQMALLSQRYPGKMVRVIGGSFSHATDAAKTALTLATRANKKLASGNETPPEE